MIDFRFIFFGSNLQSLSIFIFMCKKVKKFRQNKRKDVSELDDIRSLIVVNLFLTRTGKVIFIVDMFVSFSF